MVLNLIAIVLKFSFGQDFFFGFVPLVDLDREGNLPSYYQSCALLFCSILLMVIGIAGKKSQDRDWIYWIGLSLLFAFVSLDESISIHEQLIKPVRKLFNLSGIFYFAWVIPYGIIVALLALVHIRFFFRLPRKVFWLFAAAAACYIGGALGIELVGGYYFSKVHEQLDFNYALITTVEETMEMVGLIIFVCGLLEFIEQRYRQVQIQVGEKGSGVFS